MSVVVVEPPIGTVLTSWDRRRNSYRFISFRNLGDAIWDVIDPEHALMAIGSGGPFAQAAARALIDNTELNARAITEKALNIAADICVYTNQNLTIEELRLD